MFAGARTHTHTVARVKQSHKFKLDFMSAVSGSCQQPFISNSIRLKSLNFIYLRFRGFANWFIFNTMSIYTTVCYVFLSRFMYVLDLGVVLTSVPRQRERRKNWKREKIHQTIKWKQRFPTVDWYWLSEKTIEENTVVVAKCLQRHERSLIYFTISF